MTFSTQINIEVVQSLLTALESGNAEHAATIVDEITGIRESELYQQIKDLTNNLHHTLDELGDTSLLLQTKHDIPDMAERLEYVITTTEEASNKTLESSERALVLVEAIDESIKGVFSEPERAIATEKLAALSSELTNIMLAQSFQDLTGQVLNRVIMVISSIEQSLISLINQSKHDYDAIPDRKESDEQTRVQDMKGVGPNVTEKSKHDLAETQEDVDDLLATLGL